MITKVMWLKIAKKANELWRGAFTEEEILSNFMDYVSEWEQSVRENAPTYTIRELLRNMREDMDCIGTSEEEWESELTSMSVEDTERYIMQWYTENCSVTEQKPIEWDRLSELATLFKDGLLQDDEEQAMIYFNETCEMTPSEMEYFGISDDCYNRDEIAEDFFGDNL